MDIAKSLEWTPSQQKRIYDAVCSSCGTITLVLDFTSSLEYPDYWFPNSEWQNKLDYLIASNS